MGSNVRLSVVRLLCIFKIINVNGAREAKNVNFLTIGTDSDASTTHKDAQRARPGTTKPAFPTVPAPKATTAMASNALHFPNNACPHCYGMAKRVALRAISVRLGHSGVRVNVCPLCHVGMAMCGMRCI